MSNPAFEAARLELSQRLEALRAIIVTQNNLLNQHEIEADRLEAELAAMDRARDLLSSPEPVKKRQPVEKLVMALFQTGSWEWDERGIVEKTGLPPQSVRDFLRRAKRRGTLRCNKLEGVEFYSPPRTLEAAE